MHLRGDFLLVPLELSLPELTVGELRHDSSLISYLDLGAAVRSAALTTRPVAVLQHLDDLVHAAAGGVHGIVVTALLSDLDDAWTLWVQRHVVAESAHARLAFLALLNLMLLRTKLISSPVALHSLTSVR